LASVAFLALAVAPASSAGGAKNTTDKKMEPAYLHWYSALSQDGSVMTAIAPDRGSVDLATNLGPLKEIGYYESPLTRDPFDRIMGLMDQVGFDGMQPGPPRPPDTLVVSLGKNYADPKASVVRGWAVYDVPQELKPILDEFEAQTAELREHPVRAIRGEGALASRALSLQDVLAARVTLKNVGTQPLKLDNPFHKRMEERLTVTLAVRMDKPWDQIREGEQLWIECKLEQIRPLNPKAVRPSGRQATLPPGATLEFSVRKRLLLKPGRYLAVLTYRTSRIKGDISSMRGGLVMDLGAFEVDAR
jgi:hypothetical protein